MSHPNVEFLNEQLEELVGLSVVHVYVDEDSYGGYSECWPVLVFDSKERRKGGKSPIHYAISSDMECNGPGFLLKLDAVSEEQ